MLPECKLVKRGPGGKRTARPALGQLEFSCFLSFNFFRAFSHALIQQIFPERLLCASLLSRHWGYSFEQADLVLALGVYTLVGRANWNDTGS